MTRYILAIDQGTTSTRVFLIDRGLEVRGMAQREFAQHYPEPGLVEHDAEDIWRSVLRSIDEVMTMAGADPKEIASIGITNQRETCLLWDRRDGRPVSNAIVWQDRRTSDRCKELKQKGLGAMIGEKTGLVLDPYFSGTKLEWMLKNIPGTAKKAQNGELAFGTIDSFLVWRLTAGKAHVTDATNASRTLLMDLKTRSWDQNLLDIFGVPAGVMPKISSCSEEYGVTKGVPGLPDGIPITGMAGDQQAALIGQACFEAGEAKCTYGTGSFILLNIGREPKPSRYGLITTLAYEIGEEAAYAWEGSAFIAGAAVQWLRDGLGIIESSADVEKLAEEVPDAGGVTFVPAFVGLGAPHWRPDARGIITGITRGTTAAHIARATLEGIAFCQYDILESMAKDFRCKLSVLKVDGGACTNDHLMQFQSDILGVPISRPVMIETTALGAAFLAGLSIGFWQDLSDIRKRWREERRFLPKMSKDERALKIARWQEAVKKA